MLAPATIALVGITACTCKGTEGTALAQDVGLARQWSLVPGARLVSSSQPSRRQWSLEVSWELESDQSWPSYRAGLERAIPAGYVAVPGSERSASFRKSFVGDTYYLRVEVLTAGPPLRVAVTFVAQAG